MRVDRQRGGYVARQNAHVKQASARVEVEGVVAAAYAGGMQGRWHAGRIVICSVGASSRSDKQVHMHVFAASPHRPAEQRVGRARLHVERVVPDPCHAERLHGGQGIAVARRVRAVAHLAAGLTV